MIVTRPFFSLKSIDSYQNRSELFEKSEKTFTGILSGHVRVAFKVSFAFETDSGVELRKFITEVAPVLHL